MVDAKRTVVREQHPVLDVSRCGGGQAPGGACGDGASVAVRAAALNGVVRYHQVIIVLSIRVPADFELFQIVEAGEGPGPVLGAGKRRQEQRREDGNNGNNDQQFNESEAALRLGITATPRTLPAQFKSPDMAHRFFCIKPAQQRQTILVRARFSNQHGGKAGVSGARPG